MASDETIDKDWLELPLDVMANILSRIGVRDRLENAQRVCTTWQKIIKDPAMWRVIKIEYLLKFADSLVQMYMHAVDLSEGQLVEINIINYYPAELFLYIADSQLKCLHIACLYDNCSLPEALKKFPLLEELSLRLPSISIGIIEAASHYCPRLKTLEVNQLHYPYDWEAVDDDGLSKAIGENLPYLQHLGLIYSRMSNIGLQAILDGCHHLQSLDIRRCQNICLEGDLGKRCLEEIKYLRLPNDSLEDCPYILMFRKSYDGYHDFVASIGGLHSLIDFNSMNEFFTAYYDDDFEE